MIRLRLTHGLSHSNGYVSATWRNPEVTVDDEAAARYCVDSGFFEIIGRDGDDSKPGQEGPKEPSDENPGGNTPDGEKPPQEPAAPGQGDSDGEGDELDSMTVNELKAYAETVGIDLGKAVRKPDIVAIIRKAEAE